MRRAVLTYAQFAVLLAISALTLPSPSGEATVAHAAQQAGQASIAVPAYQDATDYPIDHAKFNAMQRIKDEGLQRSQVMDTAWYLSEVYGPRLTNSPGIRKAAAWAMRRLEGWGLENVHQETWGPFGRGWVNDKFTANVVEPQPFPLIAFSRAWTSGTNGPVTADVIAVVITSEKELPQFAGKLKGKVVLTARPADVAMLTTALGSRLTDQQLAELQQPLSPPANTGGGNRPRPLSAAGWRAMMRFFADEGVVATLEPGGDRIDHGTISVSGAPAEYRNVNEPRNVPQLVVAPEHYNRLARLLEKGIPVRVDLDIRNRYVDETLDSFNVIAEIPGTDKADEVVILGAHFDSWHSGVGATDNAAGVAATMEAMRILKALGLPMRRTVRLGLWTGEEQGLLGAREYVKRHYADRRTMTVTPAHEKMAVYFNLDNGAGAIRGIYLQGNDAARPMLASWTGGLTALGVTTLTARGAGSTDHIAFDEVGLPGFQFIQDPLEYWTHTHHTNMDLFDKLQAGDLAKNAVIVAALAYQAANGDALPRKPLPKPRTQTPNATQ